MATSSTDPRSPALISAPDERDSSERNTTSGTPASAEIASSASEPQSSRRRLLTTCQLVARSFYFASQGVAYLFRTQRNARIHLCIAAAVFLLAGWLRIRDPLSWALLAAMTTLVLVLEGVNTALEAVVDLASPAQHRLAKIAKDVAAGVVLIGAMGSVIVGLLVLAPPLIRRLVR